MKSPFAELLRRATFDRFALQVAAVSSLAYELAAGQKRR